MVRDVLVHRNVRFVHGEARLGALEMVVPLMLPDVEWRVALLYFTLSMSFAEGGEGQADTLFVGAFDQYFRVIVLASLKGLIRSERYLDERGLAGLQVGTGRRKRDRGLRISRSVKRRGAEMKIARLVRSVSDTNS